MIQPLTNHVLITTMEIEQKTKTGVILPDTVEAKETKKAKVAAIGKIINSKGKTIKPEFKKNDIIIHDSYASEIEEKNQKFMIIKYEDILGVVK